MCLRQDLSDAIDGRTWAAESEADVRATELLVVLALRGRRLCLHDWTACVP